MKSLSTVFQRALLLNQRRFFCVNIEETKQLLSKKLYTIDLINKNVNRHILSMAYSPGVGAVCQEVKQNHKSADTMTMRGRAVAIVTKGGFLGVEGKSIMPALDWMVVQVKYYSGLDPFPFVIDKNANIDQILPDFANTYGAVYILDEDIQPKKIPQDLIVLHQKDIVQQAKCEVTDAQKASSVIYSAFQNKLTGLITPEKIRENLLFQTNNFLDPKPYDFLMKDGRDLYTHSLQLHEYYNGKIHVQLNFYNINKLKPYFTQKILRELVKQKQVYSKTSQLSAIVTDGTAVLGYGNIGPMAGLPVMQGKSLLFKLLGGVQVVPFCIQQRDTTDNSCQAIMNSLGNFQAINLQDIKAPQCFEIQKQLQAREVMPIFHDDQHGTAIVTLAGLINACKVVEKNLKQCTAVINGAGAAGITIANLLLAYGIHDIVVCDTQGAIFRGRQKGMNNFKKEVANNTNKQNKQGSLKDVIKGTDIFIGVSVERALHGHWVSTMNKKSIVLAMANPIPEIMPEDAKAAGAYVYGSGRSDLQNQINNSLVFPGIFRGIREHKIKQITMDMKIKAAEAIAECLLGPPRRDYIIPDSLDKDVALRIAKALNPENYTK